MKTAIIKTTFWDDESFESLNLDSKILYFYLLANPTRTLHRITKLNDKICSAHTGLSIDQIQIAKKGLVEKKIALFKERYYILLKDYVEAKKGRYTQNVIDREEQEIPKEIKDFFQNYTGIIPVYKDKDKDKDKNKDKKIGGMGEREKEKEEEKTPSEPSEEIKKNIPAGIDLFKIINPTGYKKFFQAQPQRRAMQELLEDYTLEQIAEMLKKVLFYNTLPYVRGEDKIYSPFQLQENWAKVINKERELEIAPKLAQREKRREVVE